MKCLPALGRVLALFLLSESVMAGYTVGSNFATNPGWTGSNHQVNGNAFGYHSIGQKVGGTFARSALASSFGDTTNFPSGGLSMAEPFSYRANLSLGNVSNFNNGVNIGFYSRSLSDPSGAGILVAEHTASSVRVYVTAVLQNGTSLLSAPVVLSSSGSHAVQFSYQPTGGDYGQGRLLAIFNGDSAVQASVDLTSAHRTTGLRLDAFGLSALAQAYGAFSGEVYLDDVSYTTVLPGLPILAWWGIPIAHASLADYQAMAAAGFTWCLPPDDDRDDVEDHLDLAAQTGIKLIIQDRQILTHTTAVANHFKNHSGLGAYYLPDEPGATLFPSLGQAVDDLRAADPGHPAYINLFPGYASPAALEAPSYHSYVTSFLDTVDVDFLSFDHYGIREENGAVVLTSNYFSDLELIRTKAAQQGIPFWAFVMATPHDVCPTPTNGHLRFQAFNNLAYGAKGIAYFTYWTPVVPGGTFTGGPVDEYGNFTATYYLLATLNTEIKRWAPTLLNLESTGVYHHGSPLPAGTSGLPSGQLVTGISGSPAVLGVFQDEANVTWVMLVNRSFAAAAQTTLTFASSVFRVSILDKTNGNLTQQTLGFSRTLAISLSAGDACLLKVEN